MRSVRSRSGRSSLHLSCSVLTGHLDFICDSPSPATCSAFIMSVASTSTSSDPWDQPFHAPRRVAPAQAVPDDWDNDDEDEEGEEDQRQMWENANSKAPMPELVISGSSTTMIKSPPPAALQPTLRILKRPAATSSAHASAVPSDTPKSYAEREAQYQAARERIFNDGRARSQSGGTERDGLVSDSTSAKSKSGVPSVQIVREPRGPSAQPEEGQASQGNARALRGFTGRRHKGNTRA